MKHFLKLILAVIVLTITSCNVASVDANQEGVFVLKPVLFGKGGVDQTPLTEGSRWYVPSTKFIKFEMSPIQYEEPFEDLVAKDNNLISTIAYITLEKHKKQTPYLITNFGINWYENNIRERFRKTVRDKLSDYGMFELTTDRKVYVDIDGHIEDIMKQYVTDLKIPINVTQIVISRAKPSKGVLEEIDRTGVQMQAKLTQDKRESVEISRKKAEEARALADKAYMQSMKLSAEQYISLRALEIEKEKVEMIKSKDSIKIDVLLGYPVQNLMKIK